MSERRSSQLFWQTGSELAFAAWQCDKWGFRSRYKKIGSKEQGYLGQGGGFEGFLGAETWTDLEHE